ncbi:MFS transporter [Williamsia soli]|uniref:MFS transporter n=1 Tax=Williamsia soli TaxID=364929 RepID=UPI001A9E70E5|nr:MFS transporter [Williamsia soli]
MTSPSLRQPPDGPPRSRGRWITALACLVLLTEQTALGFTLIAPALTGLAMEYETTQIIWTITIFTLIGGVLTPVVGKLGDRFGKRKVLVGAALIALAGSILCALAPSFGLFLLGRALMGLSTAFLPVTFALIRDVFPENYRSMSIGIATNGVGVVTIVGPFLAGFLIDNYSTSAVFWFVAVISAVGAAGTLALVPESTVRNRSRIDVIGVLGLVAGLLLILYGISQLQTWELVDVKTLLTVGGGLAILIAWWMYQARTNDPFIDTAVLSTRPMATTILTYSFAGGAITVMASYLPSMLQTPRLLGMDYGFGLSATGVARYLILAGVLTVVAGIIVGALAPRMGYRPFLIIGPVIIGAGATGLSAFTTETWMPVLFYGLVGLGSIVYAAGPGMLMVVAPAESRGAAAGMMGAISAALGSGFTQLAGLALSKNVGQLVEGYPIYTARGFSQVFLIAAGMCVVAFLVALFIPKVNSGEIQDRKSQAKETV